MDSFPDSKREEGDGDDAGGMGGGSGGLAGRTRKSGVSEHELAALGLPPDINLELLETFRPTRASRKLASSSTAPATPTVNNLSAPSIPALAEVAASPRQLAATNETASSAATSRPNSSRPMPSPRTTTIATSKPSRRVGGGGAGGDGEKVEKPERSVSSRRNEASERFAAELAAAVVAQTRTSQLRLYSSGHHQLML